MKHASTSSFSFCSPNNLVRWATLASTLVWFLATGGCQPSPGAKLVGTWRMEAANGDGLLSKLTSKTNLTVTFGQDGKLITQVPSPLSGQSISQTGKWKFVEATDEVITIRITHHEDEAPNRHLKIRILGDDVVEFVPPHGVFKVPVEFRRVHSPDAQ